MPSSPKMQQLAPTGQTGRAPMRPGTMHMLRWVFVPALLSVRLLCFSIISATAGLAPNGEWREIDAVRWTVRAEETRAEHMTFGKGGLPHLGLTPSSGTFSAA
ncbi:hypothetical protein XA68_10020 [Ophiocordyceps unilateralis]|uniref:Uncharacterized protein n=1 Tax=Ophiocordyceps unilateralis TaxID=268505 RepID=A0A2A9PV64_OPHUN|nr:hypothetical protein XA68_10020 [Ophiocordyceps unilateralis]